MSFTQSNNHIIRNSRLSSTTSRLLNHLRFDNNVSAQRFDPSSSDPVQVQFDSNFIGQPTRESLLSELTYDLSDSDDGDDNYLDVPDPDNCRVVVRISSPNGTFIVTEGALIFGYEATIIPIEQVTHINRVRYFNSYEPLFPGASGNTRYANVGGVCVDVDKWGVIAILPRELRYFNDIIRVEAWPRS